jgi:hypothetical protein
MGRKVTANRKWEAGNEDMRVMAYGRGATCFVYRMAPPKVR